MEILRHYYGEGIELVQNAPIRDMGSSYPGTPLRLGSQGEAVVVAKDLLNRISQSYPAIPKIWPVTRIYDPQTEKAVRVFQSTFGLTADGVVGKATWYKMVYLYVGISQLAELVSEGQLFQSFPFSTRACCGRETGGEMWQCCNICWLWSRSLNQQSV